MYCDQMVMYSSVSSCAQAGLYSPPDPDARTDVCGYMPKTWSDILNFHDLAKTYVHIAQMQQCLYSLLSPGNKQCRTRLSGVKSICA